MNIKPMQGRVLVKVKDVQEAPKGGLILPDSDKFLIRAVVVAKGSPTPGYECSPIKVGTEVAFYRYGAQDGFVDEDGIEYSMVKYENIENTYDLQKV